MTSTTENATSNGTSAPEHHATAARPAAATHGQQHPLKLYFTVWILLFMLSACSYAVDYFNFQGYPRWTLIITFMLLKAGLIIAIFMHMAWERLALVCAIMLPPLAVLVLMSMAAGEGDYTRSLRSSYFVYAP